MKKIITTICTPLIVLAFGFQASAETSPSYYQRDTVFRKQEPRSILTLISGDSASASSNSRPVAVIPPPPPPSAEGINTDKPEPPPISEKKVCSDFFTQELKTQEKTAVSQCENYYINKYFMNSKNKEIQFENDDFKTCMISMNKIPNFKKNPLDICTKSTQRWKAISTNFNICLKNLTDLKYSVDSSVMRCLGQDQYDLASDDFVSCHNTLKSYSLSNNDSFVKCLDPRFRDKYNKPEFSDCANQIGNISGVFAPLVLTICEQPKLAKNTTQPEFKKCIDSDISENPSQRSMICSTSEFLDKGQSETFNKCVKQSLASYYKYSLQYAFYSYVKDLDSGFFEGKKNSLNRIFDDCDSSDSKKYKSADNKYLRFYKDINIHTNVRFNGLSSVNSKDPEFIGGLSSLVFDRKKSMLYALSDVGSSDYSNSIMSIKIYGFGIDKDLNLTDKELITLQDTKNKSNRVDLEGLVLTNDGKFIVSTEGGFDKKEEPRQPKLLAADSKESKDSAKGIDMVADSSESEKPADSVKNDSESKDNKSSPKDGNVSSDKKKDTPRSSFISLFNGENKFDSSIKLPEEFDYTFRYADHKKKDDKSETHGVGNNHPIYYYQPYQEKIPLSGMNFNKGIEGLSISPSNETLFAMNESSLIQDYDEKNCKKVHRNSSSEDQCLKSTRLVVFKKNAAKEFAPVEQYQYVLEPEYDNGVSELLAIDDKNILVLERSWDDLKGKLVAKIFRVTLDPSALIAQGDILANPMSTPLRKTLILDLDTIRGQLSAGFRNLDNYEAMTFGPTSPNGLPTLILATDNNFSQKQRSVILFFEILNPLAN